MRCPGPLHPVARKIQPVAPQQSIDLRPVGMEIGGDRRDVALVMCQQPDEILPTRARTLISGEHTTTIPVSVAPRDRSQGLVHDTQHLQPGNLSSQQGSQLINPV